MVPIAWILFAILSAIGALHFYWGLGGLWPGHDEKSLAKTVVGANGIKTMPPFWVTLPVAILIFVAGLFPLMWSAQINHPVPQGMVWLGMWVLTAIFIGRGIGGYLPVFRNANSEQPFADLDKKYFSPLCLLIGVGFAVLIYLAGV